MSNNHFTYKKLASILEAEFEHRKEQEVIKESAKRQEKDFFIQYTHNSFNETLKEALENSSKIKTRIRIKNLVERALDSENDYNNLLSEFPVKIVESLPKFSEVSNISLENDQLVVDTYLENKNDNKPENK